MSTIIRFPNKKKIIKNRNVVFFGAGVSLNSGIPTVYSIFNDNNECIVEGLVDYILDMLCKSDEKKSIKSYDLPFEAFIETLMLATDITPMYKVFEVGVPNHFHKTMALLAKKGIIKDFITTNFDNHLENALDNEGLVEGVDYQVTTYPFDQSSAPDAEDDRLVNLIKIHGDIKNQEELGITLRRVSSKKNKEAVLKILNKYIDSDSGNKIVFYGYSCSDSFDVNPALKQLSEYTESGVEISFIDHISGVSFETRKEEDIKSKKLKNPFSSNFHGKRLYVDTDKYISHLCEVNDIKFNLVSNFSDQWKVYIERWSEVNRDVLGFCLGNLFYRIAAFEDAKLAFENFIENYNGSKSILARAHIHLANTYAILHDFSSSVSNAKLAIKYSELLSDLIISAHAYGALGIAFAQQSDYFEARNALEKSLEISDSLNDFNENDFDEHKALLLANLSTCYLKLNESIKFQSILKLALDTASDLGDDAAKVMCLRNSSEASTLVGDYTSCIYALREGLSIAESIGQHHLVASVCLDLGNTFKAIGDLQKAKTYNEHAIEFFKKSNNMIGVGIASGNLAMFYHMSNNTQEAIEHYNVAIEESDSLNKSLYLAAYGQLLYNLERFDESVNKHKEAVSVAKSIPQGDSAIYNALNSLGSIYLGLEKNEDAKNTLLSALEVAHRQQNKIHIAQSSRGLSLALWCLREDSKSIKYARSAVEIYLKLFGEEHPKTYEARETLNKVLG
jgi:tetratricopeptide (TPR) repeat protein